MADPAPLQRAPLRERIYAVVRERIVRGELGPGAAVRDGEVAEALGASRTPVREALVRLSSEGMLESPVGRGFRVPALDAREVVETHPLLESLEPLALETSPPATKARSPAPVRMMTRTSSRSSSATKALSSARMVGTSSAFKVFGRLMVSVATAPSTSVSMVSSVI